MTHSNQAFNLYNHKQLFILGLNSVWQLLNCYIIYRQTVSVCGRDFKLLSHLCIHNTFQILSCNPSIPPLMDSAKYTLNMLLVIKYIWFYTCAQMVIYLSSVFKNTEINLLKQAQSSMQLHMYRCFYMQLQYCKTLLICKAEISGFL